jgi:hypothetical protein
MLDSKVFEAVDSKYSVLNNDVQGAEYVWKYKEERRNLLCKTRYIAAVKWITKNLRIMPFITVSLGGDI